MRLGCEEEDVALCSDEFNNRLGCEVTGAIKRGNGYESSRKYEDLRR
jgi:hypothetical protein